MLKKKKECCPTCGKKLTGKRGAEIAKEEEEYERGFNAAIAGEKCAPTSLGFLKGFERGREVRSIGKK